MRRSIQNNAAVIELRHNLMEAVYAKMSPKRTRRATRNVSVIIGIDSTHDHAFTAIKEKLAAVELSHSKPEFEMCPFTVAFDTH